MTHRAKTPAGTASTISFLLLVFISLLALTGCSQEGDPPANLGYSSNPAVYTVGTAITANTPVSTGGAVNSYSVSPALPAGLGLDTVSGVISGTPTAVTATADYTVTVTATNTGGSDNEAVSITVNPPPPAITTQPADQAVTAGQTASFNVTASGTGTLGYQWYRDAGVIGGTTASRYTTPATGLFTVASSLAATRSDHS